MSGCFIGVQSRMNPEIQKLIEENKTDRFQQRNGILVQVTKTKGGREVQQLLLPKKCRKQVLEFRT